MNQFVIELYDSFRSYHTEHIHFDELQVVYQSLFKNLFRKHKKAFTNGFPRKNEIYKIYKQLVDDHILTPSEIFENMVTSKLVRSSSGVLPISLALYSPESSCSYNCHMCPNECVENGATHDIARSYLSSEGTFIRGKIQDFNIVEQTWRRLAELEAMGHPPDKLEFILLGGTFDCFPREYRFQTAIDIFYACNTYYLLSIHYHGIHSALLQDWISTFPFLNNLPLSSSLTEFLYSICPYPDIKNITNKNQKKIDNILCEQQNINTKLDYCRVIGIVLETRPDRINRFSLIDLRKLGCTRIQLGVQTDQDDVLTYINRGHDTATTIKANQQIRDNGFKIDGHIMPDLPGTTLEKDYETVKRMFCGDDLQLDYCKIYPCLDLPYTEIRKWKENGTWKPIAETRFPEFLTFLAYTMTIVPPWTRVNRVQRDFPEASEKNHQLGYVSETIRSNLQQIVTQYMIKNDMKSYDIRSREIRNTIIDTQLAYAKLYIRIYRANEGTEFFISVEIPNKDGTFDDTNLLGLCRLRIPDYEFTTKDCIPYSYLPVFRNKTDRIARIRELHVYGNIAQYANSSHSQHRGIGKFLIKVAEVIAQTYRCSLVTIISGVGVRDYYANLGYHLDENKDQYMVKRMKNDEISLELFGKTYDSTLIQHLVTNSIISKKYIPNISNILYDISTSMSATITYHLIQKGEAQGFSINGNEEKKKKTNLSLFDYFILFVMVIITLFAFLLYFYFCYKF